MTEIQAQLYGMQTQQRVLSSDVLVQWFKIDWGDRKLSCGIETAEA